MPYPIQNLIEGRSEPICVRSEDNARKALSLMIEYDYSQLPVIDESGRPLGMVTHESILRALSNFGVSIEELSVRDAIVRASTYNPEEDLFEMLDRLRDTNSILVVDGERRLIGIVTTYDSTEFFRRRAEDMMHVEDIETMLKELLLNQFLTEDDGTDHERLRIAIENITSSFQDLKKKYKKALTVYLKSQEIDKSLDLKALEKSFNYLAPNKEQKEFDQLTLSEYIALLLHPKHWNYYQPMLNIGQQALFNLLDDIRKIRNTLAHFRDEITSDQRDQLKFCVDWLDQNINIPISWPIYANAKQDESSPNYVIRETGIDYDAFGSTHADTAPIEESLGPQESRYAPLAIWLQTLPPSADRVPITFEKVEAIIKGDLPESARKHRAWWSNDPSHSHARQWLDTGWRTIWVNLTEEKLIYVRIVEREKAYIDFFSELLINLKERVEFNVRNISPDGQSWIVVYTLPRNGPQLALFSFSFARGKRIKVELYIDTYDKERNKAIFDQIQTQKDSIESLFGEPLSWERMDDKRACRIASYHSGSIDDSKEELQKLQEWAIEAMNRFYNAIESPTTEAIGSY